MQYFNGPWAELMRPDDVRLVWGLVRFLIDRSPPKLATPNVHHIPNYSQLL